MSIRPLWVYLATGSKWVGLAAVLALGVGGGVYVGYSFVLKQGETSRRETETASKALARQHPLALGLGDAFPPETISGPEGQVGAFDTLFKTNDVLIVFADLDCEACVSLLRYLERASAEHLNSNASIVIVSPTENRDRMDLFGPDLSRFDLVFIDKRHWSDLYKLTVWPVVIGVDSSRIIIHIQYGFEGSLDFELMSRFLSN